MKTLLLALAIVLGGTVTALAQAPQAARYFHYGHYYYHNGTAPDYRTHRKYEHYHAYYGRPYYRYYYYQARPYGYHYYPNVYGDRYWLYYNCR
jgi:hypothetical protein